MSLTLTVVGLAIAMPFGIWWAANKYAKRFTNKLWSLKDTFHAEHGHEPDKK